MSGRIRRWWFLGATGGGACLYQLGCRADLIRELDLFTSPQAFASLTRLPLSNFLELFRFFLT